MTITGAGYPVDQGSSGAHGIRSVVLTAQLLPKREMNRICCWLTMLRTVVWRMGDREAGGSLHSRRYTTGFAGDREMTERNDLLDVCAVRPTVVT
jgi:hypothetical protein